MVAGRVLGDRYRIEERIAAGGMGTVYAATDDRLHRRVAVKLLKEGLSGDAKFVARFEREARAAAALSHPNVAGVFDYGEDGETPFIVMELAQGRDLARLLRDEGPLEPDRARGLGAQICTALAHAHAAGLVHRDVKPANVIVDESDRVKVTDFGIARAAGEATLTATGSVLGSAQYMAPEQASGAPVTAAADVYAAGIVLYEMLTNAVPFTGDSPVSVAMRHVSDEVPRPSSVNPQVPESLDAIVARATAKDPADRFPSAAAMGAALEGDEVTAPVAAGEATQVITSSGAAAETSVWPIPGNRYDPRRLGTRVLAVAAILAIAAVVTWGWLLSRSGDAVRDRRRAPAAARPTQQPAQAGATEPTEPASDGYELPSFTGMPFKEAEKVLVEQGIVVVPLLQPSSEERDEVVGSEPVAGTVVAAGDTVTLLISDGAGGDEGEDSDEEGPGNSEDAPGHDKDDKDKEKDKDEE
ncbi:MAG TPA: protein kinase [Actinomycetota bacterium]|nr:protein kinase [Actinomycetota bacterium]